MISIVRALTSNLGKEQMAQITFHDQKGELHTSHLQYYIDSSKVQYGVKFGVMLYKIAITNCKPEIPSNIEEYFSAYITIDANCNSQSILADLENHGADFIFVNSDVNSNISSRSVSNNYPIPVFFIHHNEDVFKLKGEEISKQYINIFFLLVLL
jgi:hypothetical protein